MASRMNPPSDVPPSRIEPVTEALHLLALRDFLISRLLLAPCFRYELSSRHITYH